MSAAVELRNVSKRFGAVRAADSVSLTIRSGEFLTLLGPSGCGKTTLLRIIAGFVAPDSGTVVIGGEEVTTLPSYRRNVNQVFQSYALFPHLTVRDNIAFGLRIQRRTVKQIAQRVGEVVSLLALEGCEDRKPHQLSGGQQQRVALARALAPDPAVLLLDEPLSALDARLRQAMQVELKRLQRQVGTTFIFVTHDQEEALTMSDRIALIQAGRVEQCGDVQEIYHRPATAFAAEFVGQTNLLEAELIEKDGKRSRCRVTGGLELRIDAARWPANASRANVSIRPEKLHLSRAPLTLENAFGARVVEEFFKGAIDRLVLATDTGTRLHALTTGENALRESFQVGDRIWCAVHADDIVVVPAP
ncbi:MAG: ABC transporter ATP-binding protein [Opitutaceae bacterium]